MSSAVTAATPLRSRIPQTPSASFPSVFIPHLPKTGTARLRLRSNAIGLVAIVSIWWQHSLYASIKAPFTWFLAGVVGNGNAAWFLNFIESIVLFVLLWNIFEAVVVIHRASHAPRALNDPVQQGAIASAARTSRAFGSSLKGYISPLSRPPSQPISLDTSSPLSTPTRARGSSSPLRFSRFSSASSHVLGTDVTLSTSRSFDGYPSSSLSSHPGKAFNASMIERLLDTSDE